MASKTDKPIVPSFRALRRSDLGFLIEIRNECRAMLHDDSAFSLQQAEAWFDQAQPRFYIIEIGSTRVGYFRTSHWDRANRRVMIGCDIHPEYRGRGIARAAYLPFLRHLFLDLNLNKVSLEVLENNDRARRLYEALGFVLEGRKRQEIWREGRYLDSALMSILSAEFSSRYPRNLDQAIDAPAKNVSS